MGLKECFLSSALHVPRPGPRVTRNPCLAGLSSSVPGSPAAAKRRTDRAQVPRARGEAGEATVLTDHFLEPPECTPGPRSSCRHYCSVRPAAAAAGCGATTLQGQVWAPSRCRPAAALPRPGCPGTSQPRACLMTTQRQRWGLSGGPALRMLQTPHPRGLHPSQEGGCGEPGGRPAVPGTEGELWDPL